MKRVLVVGQSDNPGGVEAVIKRYYEAVKQEIQFDLIVSTQVCYDEDYYRKNHCQIYFIQNAQFKHPLRYRREMKTFFKERKGLYDAIWYNGCDLANSGYIMKMAKQTGIKKRIIHAHNNQLMQTGKKRYCYELMHQYRKNHIDRYATDFWACSELAGEFFYKQAVLDSRRFKVINNAIEAEKYYRNDEIRHKVRTQLKIMDDYIVMGHVGRFQYQKNHELLIDIFKQFHEKHCNSRLILVGQGVEEERIRHKVQKLNLENAVIFMGARNDVNEIMQAMDIFVLPSRFEGLGIVLIEAQAAGLPCVTTKNVVPDIVNVTGNVAFVELGVPLEQWLDCIDIQLDKKMNYDQIKKDIVTSGYDMTTAGETFKKLLEQ